MSSLIFDWDPVKARSNLRKHKVSFDLATTVLRDPLALTIYDLEHSEQEDRWITVGLAESGQILVVVHSWRATENFKTLVRIISARRADPLKTRNYRESTR
jgi:uncharacterized DUF497 family protein